MATKASISKKQAVALARLESAMQSVGKTLRVKPLVIPTRVRGGDKDLLRARQLEAYAIWAEKVAAKVAKGKQDASDSGPAE